MIADYWLHASTTPSQKNLQEPVLYNGDTESQALGYTYPPSSWISDNWGRRTGTPLSVCLLRQIGNCIWKAHQAQVKNHDFSDGYSSVLTCQHLANVLFNIDWTHSIKCRDKVVILICLCWIGVDSMLWFDIIEAMWKECWCTSLKGLSWF